MFLADKKKAATVILSKMDKDGRHSEAAVAPESGEHDVYSSFAEDLLHAFESKSVHGVAAALKKFHSFIAEEDEEQDAEG